MIDMTHDGDYRRTRHFDTGIFYLRFSQHFLLKIIITLHNGFVAHFLNQNNRCFLVYALVDGRHNTQFHQMLDNHCRFNAHFLGEIGHNDHFWY